MNILIIEDDSNKMRRIAHEISMLSPKALLTEARSYQNGVKNLMTKSFDFLLLDMSLPVFDISPEEDGYQIDPFSGRNILTEMQRKRINVPTVVMTMFETFGDGTDIMTLDELDKDLEHRFPENYKGIIYYNASEINWKDSLKKITLELIHD